ncbi:MAG: MogA/MoaB family molybdenum cofactor biosynthesis protein [Pyrinomonadaceae bacterium]|nr:MogA/MoaB family molybdenum cofactor biosynthesis protein [Pyrinomonadaceae bacterium]MCX7638888.1 MogA/MoaB family molybdenum cofactor biosynthesis protein [Pyrinomonadaceae bacterium]MDW8304975.1 MogA/MoaB family molybdenum cofactor biosynthesis protein [Acidobacteriota bacterium]
MEDAIRAVVVTVSDSRHEEDDLSGTTLVGLLLSIGAEVVEKVIIRDEVEQISRTLVDFSNRDDIDLIVTTGGTGIAPRDNTPEATLSILEKQIPGIAEAIRLKTMEKTPTSILSRGVCGIRNRTLIINFPGSPKAVQECFDIIKPILLHAINLIKDKKVHH